jgi:hypothetical protein
VIAYKVLRADATSLFTGFRWPLPDASPGAWIEAAVEPCRSGIHACRTTDLPYWLSDSLYEIELAGDIVAQDDKVVAARGRLLRKLTAWDELRDAYTRRCADRAHELALGASPALEQWDAVIERSTREGPALLGFIAARIAEERDGPAAYRAERERQTAWLVERLRL